MSDTEKALKRLIEAVEVVLEAERKTMFDMYEYARPLRLAAEAAKKALSPT